MAKQSLTVASPYLKVPRRSSGAFRVVCAKVKREAGALFSAIPALPPQR